VNKVKNREVFGLRRQINFRVLRLFDKFVIPIKSSVKASNIYISILFFAFCLLPSSFCLAQVSSPAVKCLTVFPVNGNVTLTWVTPSAGSGFLDYLIYSAPAAAGPYTLVGTVSTFIQTSFTDITAGANLARKFYKVQTEYNPGPVLSAPIDTFATIFLTVSGASIATLNWNKISLHPIATSTGWYRIYREYPTGNWVLRDSTKNLTYKDTIDVCNAANDSIFYRIEIDDNSGCTSFSNKAGKVLTDLTPPVPGPLDTVSVDPATSKATISWIPSPSPDADSVVIYKGPGALGPWNRIATVPVPVNSYTYAASLAANISEYYRIAFLDSCGNISPQGIYHRTIYLSVSFDICASTATLLWNKYVNWIPGVTQYEILKSVNAGPFSIIGTTIPSDTNYTDSGLQLGTAYCYIIRATNGTRTSSSNKVCFTPGVTQPPLFTYERFATVKSNTSILLKAHVDMSSSVKFYRIQRATAPKGSFSVIMPVILPTGNTITHTDNGVITSSNSYIYKVEAMDSCQHVIMASNLDSTILLYATIEPNLDITLSWNDYGNFLGKVDHYEVYRAVDGVWGAAPVSTVAFTGSGGTYTDDVAPYLSSRGFFSYYVVAIEGSGDTFSFTDSSFSNVVKVNEYPKFYVPNTFTPNGDNLNDVFIPVIGFIDPDNYDMMVFDNTGTPCFETHNSLEGWDGKKRGHPCMEGVYMYLIKCKASNGDDSKISGTISLYR
jgi:gliding motility-associated-like protein